MSEQRSPLPKSPTPAERSLLRRLSASLRERKNPPQNLLLNYLPEDDRPRVERLLRSEILPFIRWHPELKSADLVIEGGIGREVLTAHALRAALPDAMHMAMDIYPRFRTINRRQRGQVDSREIASIITANEHPDIKLREAIMYANAFDGPLLRDLLNQTGNKRPILVSRNTLGSFVRDTVDVQGRKDAKDPEDLVTMEDIVDMELPYVAQWHMLAAHWVRELERRAVEAGWQTELDEQSLLMLKPEFLDSLNIENE